MPQPLLTLEDAARRLSTTIFTVRRWIHEGKIVGTKIGGEWRIDPVDLEDFIQRGKTVRKQEDSQDA